MSDDQTDPPEEKGPAVSRRSFFLGAGGLAASGLIVGAAAGAAGAFGIAGSTETAVTDNLEYPYYDQKHQGGVATPPQKYAVFMVYDLAPVTKFEFQVLLARWTAAI